MSNPYINGWLAEQEASDAQALFGDAGNLQVVGEDDAITRIKAASENPVTTHPWVMSETLFENHELPFKRLTVYNQDANNCAGQGTSRAVEAFMTISKWIATRRELTPFEIFVPWVWGVGKNEAGQPGTGGATMSSMLSMITNNGVLPADTPGLPPYKGTSNAWARNYGKQAKNAPYSQYWSEAKQFIVTAAQLPKDPNLFYLACKAGYSVAFGTSQKIVMSGSGYKRTWKASGSWMHAMAAYGYDAELDAVGIDNSHGDGHAWADKSVIKSVVAARYFEAFVILDITPRKAAADWRTTGRN